MRYYGYYSNVSRGKRKKEKPEEQEIIALDPQPVSKELKKRWSYFIRKVYEADPLTCPKCQGEMWFDRLTTLRELERRIISFIDQPEVIKKILPVCVRTRTGRQPLGLWEESHAPPGKDPPVKGIAFRGEPSGRASGRVLKVEPSIHPTVR